MTYIGSYDNGKIAVNVADKKATVTIPTGKRESDNTYKIINFKTPYAEGVILSTGSLDRGNIASNFATGSEPSKFETLDDLVKAVCTLHKSEFEEYKNRLFAEYDNQTKLSTIELEKNGKQLVESFKNLVTSMDANSEGYKEAIKDIEKATFDRIKKYLDQRIVEKERGIKELYEGWSTTVMITAYDKKENKIRNFLIDDAHREMHLDGIQQGSGFDLANAYLQKATQGLPRKTDLKLTDLIYCSVGAYVAATQNSGVGGEPTISITEKDGVKFMDEARCRLLANLLGKVEAEASTKAETYPLVAELVEDWREGKPLDAFLQKHNIPEEQAKVAYTIGQWMARTNREVLQK